MKNLLTDIPGVRVGHADDAALASGVTAVIFDEPAVAAIDVRGGGPGTRDSALLDPPTRWSGSTPSRCRAARRSGWRPAAACRPGSPSRAAALRSRGARDSDRARRRSCSICLNGGDKTWGRFAPYRDLGYAAAAAAGDDFALGSAGAGLGATTANFKGGLGSASAGDAGRRARRRHLRWSMRSAASTVGDGPWFWAAPFEIDGEFGGRGLPPSFTPDMLTMRLKGGPWQQPPKTPRSRWS